MLTNIEMIEKFDQYQDDQNRDFPKILKKNRQFSKILTKIEMFANID